MREFVDQEFLRENGVVGDCWRACLANLLELPSAEVPHFVEQYGDHWLPATSAWLEREHGEELHWWPATFPFGEASRPHVILLGRSPRSGEHAVLADAQTGDVVHDPHPSRAGLLSLSGAFITTRKKTAHG